MRGSDGNWPADDVAPDATDRTGGSRMLLDDLMAERERAQMPQIPDPVLTVDPVAVPPLGEVSRKETRQRLADLESVARRNLRSAEEARQVLREEHERLQAEASARTKAQQEAASLRRELERLRDTESRRALKEKTRAARAARDEIANELKRFQDEHERVVRELNDLRGTMTDHDSLLDDYNARLREDQQARAALRAELERAEAARQLAERSLEAATSGARRRAEDEMIRLATAEQELMDARSDRDRLQAKIDDLTAGDGALARLAGDVEARDAEIARLNVRVSDLEARIEASEDAATRAIAERDEAIATLARAEHSREEAERAKLDGDLAVDVARARINELESTAETRVTAADDRAHAAERALEQLRREAAEATEGRRVAEGALARAASERDELRARLAAVERGVAPVRTDALAAEPQPAEDAGNAGDTEELEHPPLPTRVAGRRAPAAMPVRKAAAPPLERRRRDPASAPVESALRPAAAAAAAIATPEEPREPAPVPAFVAVEPDDAEPGEPARAFRRTAMAELTAIASASGDDVTHRRR